MLHPHSCNHAESTEACQFRVSLQMLIKRTVEKKNLPETNSELTHENLVVFGVSDPFLLGFYSIFRCFLSLFVLQSSSIIKVFTSNCLANKLECRATQFPIALVTKTLRLCSLRWKRPQKKGVVAPHAINFQVIFNLIQVCCTK